MRDKPQHLWGAHGWRVGLVLLLACTHLVGGATLDVNRASPPDLQAFKGIGPAMGQRIQEARQQKPFQDWPDLMKRVKGMGAQKADALSSQGLTVNGLRYGEVGIPPARPWQPFEATPLVPNKPIGNKP